MLKNLCKYFISSKNLLLILFLTSTRVQTNGQDTLIRQIHVPSDFFTTDYLGNIYLVNNNILIKYWPEGDSCCSYSLGQHGKFFNADFSTPNQIIIYFQGTRKMIVLDEKFAEKIKPFYLDEIGMYEISHVISTADGGYWFYNPNYNSLLRMNSVFQPMMRAVVLDRLFSYPKTPVYFLNQEGYIYLNVPSNGILVLNQNGRYITAFDTPGILDFQLLGPYLYFYRDYFLMEYNTMDHSLKKIFLPTTDEIINVRCHNGRVLIHTPDGISIYRLDRNWPREVFLNK